MHLSIHFVDRICKWFSKNYKHVGPEEAFWVDFLTKSIKPLPKISILWTDGRKKLQQKLLWIVFIYSIHLERRFFETQEHLSSLTCLLNVKIHHILSVYSRTRVSHKKTSLFSWKFGVRKHSMRHFHKKNDSFENIFWNVFLIMHGLSIHLIHYAFIIFIQ